MMLPVLHTSNPAIDRAWRIAMGAIQSNIQPYPVAGTPQPVLLAGLDYDTPWTRDAAINVWNGLGLIQPEVARNTLLSVLEGSPDHVSWRIIGRAVGCTDQKPGASDSSAGPVPRTGDSQEHNE